MRCTGGGARAQQIRRHPSGDLAICRLLRLPAPKLSRRGIGRARALPARHKVPPVITRLWPVPSNFSDISSDSLYHPCSARLLESRSRPQQCAAMRKVMRHSMPTGVPTAAIYDQVHETSSPATVIAFVDTSGVQRQLLFYQFVPRCNGVIAVLWDR